MTTSTSTTTAPATGEPTSKLPYSIAFGLALVVSCASYIPAPTYSWTFTSMGGVQAPGSNWSTTSSPPVASALASKPEAARTPTELITDLRLLSGLTTDQVGRLLGVSRRSVHNWLSGSSMASQHAERVSAILAIVNALEGTPEQRRAALLDSSKGQSLFHKLLQQLKPDAALQVAAVSVGERITL